MKILVLNGSPKGEKSNTMHLTKAFLEGMEEIVEPDTEILPVYKMNIKPCIGCFSCWSKTPGKCCIQDDMASVIEKILAADLIIWSFPLYYFNMPSQLKAVMDRQLPMNLPFMVKGSENGSHPSRYDMSGKRFVFISTCGFYTPKGNYISLNLQLDRLLGKGNYETLYCGEGELFRVPELRTRTDAYLQSVKAAGKEYASGGITAETKEKLGELLYPRDVFEQMADASWGIEAGEKTGPDHKQDSSLSFTRQMAALYNTASWSGQDKVLEMHYTDVKKTYQIVLGKNGHTVLTENFLPFTTKIETPLSVWMSIAKGEMDGQTAMMEHRYRVEGDFDLMIHWNEIFGSQSSAEKAEKPIGSEKKTNMTLMLLPWFPIWFLLSVNPSIGGVVGVAASAALPFTFLKWKATIFEYLSVFLVSCIGLLAILGYPVSLLVPASYLLFGIMWSSTVFLKIPLTAYYSMYGYGEENALKNKLFIRTNRILTACWGILYLVTPLWTYFLIQSQFSAFLGIINSILPALLGIFTKWFQKWYPSYYAQKGKS